MRTRTSPVLTAILVFAICCTCFASASASRLMDDARSQLRQLDQSANGFSFMVLADSHVSYPGQSAQLEVFRQIVREANALNVAAVFACGDLQPGYADEPKMRKMWEGFVEVVKTCQVPFFAIVGNHDIDAETGNADMHRRLWLEYMGPVWYSLDYGGCHFIAMDSEEPGYRGKISAAQLRWLRQDLTRTRARHIFVFMHEPIFQQDPAAWAEVHQVLRKHPVRAVFAGHWHEYHALPQQDGIRYYIAGSSGGEIGDDLNAGEFHHYMVVSVRGSEVHETVVRPGNILPRDILDAGTLEQRAYLENRLDYKQIPRFAELLASGLAGVRDPRLVEGLAAVARSGDANAQAVAVATIERLREPAFFAALQSLLAGDDAQLRLAAARGIAATGIPQAPDVMLKLLAGDDRKLVLAGATALGQLGRLEDVPALRALLVGADTDARRVAAVAISRIGGTAAADALRQVLDDPDAEISVTALRGIGQLGGPEDVSRLSTLLASDREEVRVGAAEALGGLAGAEAVLSLSSALSGDDRELRLAAASALGRAGSPAAVRSLVAVLGETDRDLRVRAVRALGLIGGSQAFEALTGLLSSGDPAIRGAVIEAIGMTGVPEATDCLAAAERDPSPDVRNRALRAIESAGRSHPAGTDLVTFVPLAWRAAPDRACSGEAEGWYRMDFDDSAWSVVRSNIEWYKQRGPLQALRKSNAWGRVWFDVDPKWSGRGITMRIGALDEQGIIYLNGEQAFVRQPGPNAWKTPFELDVTGKLRFGEPNLLVVKATAETSLGGVWSPVSLYTAPK